MLGEINGKENQSITQRTPISRYTIGILSIFEKNMGLKCDSSVILAETVGWIWIGIILFVQFTVVLGNEE
jgi:hypothetical protein